jgi:hypothetical protein
MIDVACDASQCAFHEETEQSGRGVTFSSEIEIDGFKERPVKPNGIEQNVTMAPTSSHESRGLLYKAEDMRKDQIVSRVLQLMEAKLREAGIMLPIQTYTVTPTSISDGLLEMVPLSSTVTNIKNKYGSVKAYLNVVAERTHEPLAVVRRRFVESYAAFTVMMFLLVCLRFLLNLPHFCREQGTGI